MKIFSRCIFSTALLALPVFFPFTPLIAAADTSTQRCIDEFCFDRATNVSGSVLPLLGIGQVHYLGFLGYSAALYGPSGSTTSEKILAPVTKKLVILYYRTITPDAFIKSSEKIMRENPETRWQDIESGFAAMNKLYEEVKRGDRYEISYDPNSGLSLALNGVLKGTIVSDAFAKAYFGIWLSKKPISESLRDALLGSKS